VALNLAGIVKVGYIRTITLVLTLLVVFGFCIQHSSILSIDHQPKNANDEVKTNSSLTRLSMKINTKSDYAKIAKQPTGVETSYYDIKAVSKSAVIRGNSFVVSGQLIDYDTGLGIPNQEIKIFWNNFSWTAYEADPSGFEDTYEIASGYTNSNGYYSITVQDTNHEFPAGAITVYSVFLGDPDLGPIELTRQFTSDTIDCYASVTMTMGLNQTSARINETIEVTLSLAFDNSTSVAAANGENITLNWLGVDYNVTIVGNEANTTIFVENDTTIGVNHPVKGSFNISSLSLAYVVGSITLDTDIGTTTADWANRTRNIYVYSGAGITFDIDDPLPPGIGLNPTIIRNDTPITLSGTITDDFGDPFGIDVDMTIFVDSYSTIGVTANPTGLFSRTFIINETGLTVGDHLITLNVDSGQGITATSENESITIVGNSTIATPFVNGTSIAVGTALAMPGEIIQVSGSVRDAYSNLAVVAMPITAQWEDFGAIYNTTTSGTGGFTLNVQIPLSVTSTDRNGTIHLVTESTSLYSSSNLDFTIDVFTDISFAVRLNNTIVTNGASITNLGGNIIYNDTDFTFNCNVTDQFGRIIAGRNVSITIASIGSIIFTLGSNGNISTLIDASLFQNQTYLIYVIFIDKPSQYFSFEITFRYHDLSSTPSSTSPNGGSLDLFALIILIVLVSIIIVVSIVYAFGRFRKSKKIAEVGIAYLDLATLMKQIEESDKAKDYRRAVVLCYHAFELICIENLGIANARSQSPRELARIVASTNSIPVRDVTMLVMRYEEARFSDHKIVKNAFTLAHQALQNIQLAIQQKTKAEK